MSLCSTTNQRAEPAYVMSNYSFLYINDCKNVFNITHTDDFKKNA